MKSNTILKMAMILFKTGIVFSFTLLVCFVGIFIYSFVSPKTFEKVTVKHGYEYNYTDSISSVPNSHAEYIKEHKQDLYYVKLGLYSKIIILLYQIAIYVPAILILSSLIRFLRSVNNYNSFFTNNSLYFSRIASLFGLIFIIRFIFIFFQKSISMDFPDGSVVQTNISIDFNSLALGIFSMLLSKVFEEGEKMRIENELTV